MLTHREVISGLIVPLSGVIIPSDVISFFRGKLLDIYGNVGWLVTGSSSFSLSGKVFISSTFLVREF